LRARRRIPRKTRATDQDDKGRGAWDPEARGHSHSEGSSDPRVGLKGKQAF